MNFCGVLNLDKPEGVTSREVVDRVVRLVRRAKVGHAGTLDPLATGVLVVCVGHATRLISIAQEGRKRYRGRFVLGHRSDTDDVTGQMTQGGDWSTITETQLADLLPEFTGTLAQVPPQFSAVHVQGRRAYELARLGQSVELSARPVEVYSLTLTDFQPPEFELEVECGSGTYLRSIGRDLGDRLGCGAVMKQLRRLSVGDFEVTNSIAPDELTAENIERHLKSPLELVTQFHQRRLTLDEIRAVRCGQSVALISRSEPHAIASESDNPTGRIALVDVEGQLLGIGESNPTTNRLQPRIIFPADK